jgi:hypothetical protein
MYKRSHFMFTSSTPQILFHATHPCTYLLPIYLQRGICGFSSPKPAEQSWVRSQHPPTQWNLRGGKSSSVEYSTRT